jgi:hypothetical protein
MCAMSMSRMSCRTREQGLTPALSPTGSCSRDFRFVWPRARAEAVRRPHATHDTPGGS